MLVERMTIHSNLKHAMLNRKSVDVLVTSGYEEESKVMCQFTIDFKTMAKHGPKYLFDTVKKRMKNLGYTYDAYKLNLYEV